MSDFEQLVRASRLYYELGETQNAIAELLGVTRPQVSRLLKRARAEGIVEIRIVDTTAVESPAGDALRRSYGLDQVHLAPTIAGPEDLTRRMVGRLAAEVLRAAVRPGTTVGIGDGASVSAAADALEDSATPVAVTVVPLCGGFWSTGQEREPYRRIAEALGGQVRGLMAPGLVDDAATRTALVAHAGVRAIADLWDRLDVALFGIGGPAWASRWSASRWSASSRPPRRSARSSWHRSTSTAGSSVRPCATGSSPSTHGGSGASPRRSGWRPARARSARSWVPCGPASSAPWSPTWRPPRRSSRSTRRPRRRTGARAR